MRSLLALGIVLAAAALAATPAAADPPGSWTLVHTDSYRHYACKARGKVKGRWQLRVESEPKIKRRDLLAAGIYAAVARRSDRNLVDRATTKTLRGGYMFLTLRGATDEDRLWVQAALYGPAAPWRDGFRVERIVRCNIA